MTRIGGSLAVACGAAFGVLIALLGRETNMDAPLPPAAARAPEIARDTSPQAAGNAAPAAVKLKPELRAPELTPSAASITTLAASAAVAPEPRRASESAPIASLTELQALEVRCYEQDSLACRRAANAYENGGLVPRDTARARTYRRVELTQLVRHCEKGTAKACLVLADLYEHGDGVAKSPRKAEQLTEHARDLCRRRPSEDCSGPAAAGR